MMRKHTSMTTCYNIILAKPSHRLTNIFYVLTSASNNQIARMNWS